MKWWSPPKQRQRWGEAHILPSDNWGQIFFDLFYVGGAYNLGNLIKSSDMGWQSILYFCAAGFPSMMMWYDKLYFDARFTTRPGHDIFHRVVEIIQLCCVATALSRIRSVDVLSHPCSHIDVFQFTLSLFLNSLVVIARYVEVIKFGIGDPAASIAARRDIAWRIVPTIFLFAAALESGISYYSHKSNNYYNYNGGEDWCPSYENPIWYCLASWLSWVIIGYCDRVIFAPKWMCIETTVPMNVHFVMHRYGEWFMLMFGESIMSLLVVEGDNESVHHSVKFYSGVLSVICLAHLHFQSEPKHNEDHALTRSRHSNYAYTVLVPVYSMALIATGICYKMFLYDYKQKDGGGAGYRRILGDSNYGDGDDGSDYAEKKQQFTADVFSGSITIVLICTDLMVLLHQGSQAVWNQIRRVPRSRLALLVVSKYSLVFFLMVMSAFQNDPHFMAMFGLGAILFQEVLRRSFVAWQLRVNHAADDSSTDSDTTVRTTFTGYSDDDDNYQHEIQSFADAKLAFAKFEQQWMVEAKEKQQQQDQSSSKMKDVYDNTSSYQDTGETKEIVHNYYAC